MAFLHSMAYPFLACLVLTGIHVYLGIHVISRKVIFVDLALAQIAAFGAVWGVLLGWDMHADPWQIKGFSLALTFLGAAVFSLTRMKHERVPHEAIIGISYAVALAATILASAHLAHGAEEVQDLLAGSILWVRGETIAATAALYAAIGAFHYVFRKRFLSISLDEAGAEARGINVRLWDFLFYVSFGFVVTSSVSIAGVLLVFSYLVIPSVVGVLFAESVGGRLAVGWTVGTVVSAAGVSVSYWRDLPSGPTIVVCFGAFLIGAGLLHYLIHAPRRGVAALRVLAGAGLAVALFLGGQLFRKREHVDLVHVLQTGVKAERMLALARVEAQPELFDSVRPVLPELLESADVEVRMKLLDLIEQRKETSLLPDVLPLLRADDDVLRERTLKVVKDLGRPESAQALLAAAEKEPDEDLVVEMGEAALELGDPGGIRFLLDVMDHGEARQVRRDAWEHFSAHVPGVEPPYDPLAGSAERSTQVSALRAWIAAHPDRVAVGRLGEVATGSD